MSPKRDSLTNGSGLSDGQDIAAQVERLEKKIALQASKHLMLAAASGNTSDAVRAIDEGAEIDATVNGYTPLMRAGHVGTVVALVGEGADMFATDRSARTALDWARIARRDKVARVLERAMENEICYRRETGEAERGKRELWGVIRANARHSRDVTTAVGARCLDEVKRIVDRAKLTRPEFLSACVRLGLRSEGVEVVLERDESMTSSPPGQKPDLEGDPRPMTLFFLDAEAPGGATALALATAENDVEAVRRFIQEGADPLVESRSGHTALTWAAACGVDLVVGELLRHRGRVDDAVDALTKATAYEGKTALHCAALNGNPEVAMILLDRLRNDLLLCSSFSKQRRSDDTTGPVAGWFYPFRDFVRRKDHGGCTAWDLADKAGHAEVTSLLHTAESRIEAWEARERADEHAAQRIECGNDGCRHRDRRDRMGRHENHDCPRRPAGCPACGKKLAAGELEFHQARECAKRRDACPYAMKGCCEVMPHDRIASHVMHVCKFRRVECRRQCGATLDARDLESHELEHCRLSKHPCVLGCGQDITKESMTTHVKKHCSKRKVRCTVGCGEEVQAGSLEYHEREVCTETCRWEGCGARIGPLARRQMHERFLCPHRPAECPYGCEISGLTEVLKDAHASNHCRLRPLPCPHGCGTNVPSIDMPAHVRAEGGICLKRLQRCRFDCLGRSILVARKDSPPEVVEGTNGGGQEESLVGTAVPGILKTYNPSTGLFRIRYSDGYKLEALEDLEFVWADHGRADSLGSSGLWECGWIEAAGMCDHLEQTCPLRSVMCRDGCGQRIVVKDAEKHYQGGCPKRFVLCSLGCRAELRQEQLGEHEDTTCPLRRVSCDACGSSVPLPDYSEHVAERCPRVPRRCTNGCGSHVRGEDLVRHLSTECSKRVVPCPLGCPETGLWAEEVEAHARVSCPLSVMPCRAGCGIRVAMVARQDHEQRDCPERILTCECGSKHAFSKTEEHRITACPAVLRYCTLGCGVKVRKMDMDKHQEGDCERKTLRNLTKIINCPRCRTVLIRQWEFQHRVFDCPKRPVLCPRGCSADITADEEATHFMTCGRRRICCGANSTGCERMLLTWVGKTLESEDRERNVAIPFDKHSRPGHQTGLEENLAVACSDHGSTALMWAAGEGDSELALLRELIKFTGSDGINHESHHGDTAMTIACSRGHAETVRVLVGDGNADVNYETRAGKTPLIEASRHGRTTVIRLLVELRANVQYANRRGQTAVWWAKRLGHQDCFVPMTREVQAEANLRLTASQIAHGDIEAVRALVGRGEPHRDNHCERLEAEIDQLEKDLQMANKELREMLDLKEELAPELERLKESLAADLDRRRRVKLDAKRSARARTKSSSATINSRSFEAMRKRALGIFHLSVSHLQALTEDDFKKLAEEIQTSPAQNVDETNATDGRGEKRLASSPDSTAGRGEHEYIQGVSNPTPSLSAAAQDADSPPQSEMGGSDTALSVGQERDCLIPRRGSTEQEGASRRVVPGESESDLEGSEENAERLASSERSAAVLRVLRSTVLVLGGCGLGALPSDKVLWRAVKPMLLDGSLRHRVRHFDRRRVPVGVMDAVRALLNVGNTDDRHRAVDAARDHPPGTPVISGPPPCPSDATTPLATGKSERESSTTLDSLETDGAGNRIALVAAGGKNGAGTENEGASWEADGLSGSNSVRESCNAEAELDSDGDDDDPWGDGVEESRWGRDTRCPLTEALGAWCASVSAYDRLAHPPAGSAVERAKEAESDWDESERRIARDRLNVEIEEIRNRLLSAEIANRTTSIKSLSQKRSWGEDRLGIARVLSLVFPTGHSLISWAAAFGQTELVELLLDHGATAGPGDEMRSASASIIQIFYRFHRHTRRKVRSETSPHDSTRNVDVNDEETSVVCALRVQLASEGGRVGMMRRMAYTMEMLRRQAGLVRLRKTRRLPLTEAAYNGHYEVLELLRARRIPLYSASRTWLYPSAPPPFALTGGGLRSNELDAPMSIADCAAAGLRDRGCRQHLRKRRWVAEDDGENRFARTRRAAGAIWVRGVEKTGRRRALREKEGALIDRETARGKTALIGAAEEDPEAVGHKWLRDEDGSEVLAGALLLDRPIHCPKIDYESRVTGHTALTRACALGCLGAIEVLLDRGADIDRVPILRPMTPNRHATHRPWSRELAPPPTAGVIAAGVAAGAEDDGRIRQPPLIVAAAAGHAAVVRLLLERGADAGVRDRDCRTAADVAKREAFMDVLAELARREAGCLGIATGARGVAKPLVSCGWGCGALVAIGRAKSEHENDCAHREVECTYSCGESPLQWRQLEHHLAKTCRMRPVMCGLGCGLTVVAEEYANHQATACAMRPVFCTFCKKKVPASALDKHLKETCPQRMVECEQGCGSTVPVASMPHHLDKTCPRIRVTCRMGCGASMSLEMRLEHEARLCSERLVDCKWRCGQIIKAKHLDEHETRQCPRADVECGNRCGVRLPLGDLHSHYAESCAHRFMPCGLGCGYKVRAKDVSYHETNECGARLITCPRVCGEDVFPARALEVHLKYGCALRRVKCTSCGEEILARELDSHRDETCRGRLVSCGNRPCPLRLAAEYIKAHEERECEFRRVWCLQGCGQEMRADTRHRHHRKSCPMRYIACPLGCPKKVVASD